MNMIVIVVSLNSAGAADAETWLIGVTGAGVKLKLVRPILILILVNTTKFPSD